MKNSKSKSHITKSKLYDKLADKATFAVRTTHSTAAGVRVESHGTKKGSSVEVLLPSTTITGGKRVVKVEMSGRQARALYETLSKHFGR